MSFFGRTRKMSRRRFNLDERGTSIVRRISTVLYIFTLYALIGIQLYRQFVLHQPRKDWQDIAVIITINAIAWIGSLLYLSGVINPTKIKPAHLLVGYLSFVLIGFLFTIFKYTVLLGQALELGEVLDYLFIVIKVSAGLLIVWALLAYIGSKRIEKQIE